MLHVFLLTCSRHDVRTTCPFSRRFLMGTTSRSGFFLNRARSMQKRSRMLIISLFVFTSCVTILGINPFSQHAKAQASPRATVAAINPSLVAGRGAQLGIVE